MPKALALESNPFGRINELRSLLTDRYSRTAILKEWLQNADDAGATAVLVASVETPPGCAHELLAAGSPAVMVLNDGKFDEKDSLAIRQFGLNNKSGDGAAIGKFGLGLKSVFHLCEGFFFLSPKSTADDPDGVFNNLVSPWSGTAHHAHWGDVDPADLDRMKAHLAPACRRMGERWFALWLPLRRRDYTHSARILNEPHDLAPGELLAPPDVIHLAPAAALLKQLSRVELWDGMPADDDRPAHRWELLTPGERTSYPCWAPPNAAPATTGATRAGECDDGSGTASYALVEAWRNEKWANDAQGHDGWPSRFDLQGVPQRDKAQPHAAVVLTRRHGHEDGRLHDALAVFLPLTAGAASNPPPADAEFLLLRHGCFFVDSGRGGAYAGDGVRGEWNRELMRDGVLPLVVPAVAKLTEKCDVAVTRRLTVAVHGWMVGHDRGAVCRDGGWACRWQPSGSRWEVIRNEVRVFKIPAFPEDGLPARVLPGLAGLAGDCALIPATEPRLLARDPEPWPDELLGRVLAVPEARPLLDGDALGYLVEFVALHRGQFGGSARQSLADTLRRVFAVAGNGELAEHKDRLVRLVGEIPPDRRRRLSLGGNWPAKTRQAVCGVSAVLIVPDGFDPAHAPGVGLFATPDAVGVLKLLAADMSVGRNTNPAAEVIDASAEPAAVCDATAELPLWKVQRPEPDEKRDTDELRSLADLRTALDAQSLFVGPQNDELRELAAAVHTRLAVLNGDTARTIFAETPPPRGDTNGLLVHLQTAPGLRGPEARAPLIRRLMGATGDESFRTRRRWAVRYLIHGNRDLSAKDDVYLPAGGAEVWARMALAGLTGLGQPDHLLPANELARELNSHQREELGLRPLDPDGVAAILDRVPDLSGLGVEDDGERDIVLRGLQQHPKLIRRLPLHDRVGGGRVCLTDDSYWRDGAGVGLGTLADVVTLVIPHTDEVLAAIQKKASGRILTHREVVSLAIRHRPEAHWDTLLTAMASAGPLGREQAEPLTERAWIPTADGTFVSPNEVVFDEKFNDEITAAVKRAAPSAGDPVPFARLHHDVRVHVGFAALKRLFPDRKQALSKLGGLLGRSPQFHTGNVEGVAEWCEAFGGAPPDIMAAAPLITQVHRHAPDECRSHLLPALDKRPTLDRLEKVLAFLRDRHDRAAGPSGVIRRMHDGYLKQAANDPKFGDLLPRLRLLNSADPQRWVPVRELCAGVDGIDHSRALDPVQDDILGSRVARLPAQRLDAAEGSAGAIAAAEREFDASAARLRDYFLPWRRTELLSAWAGAFVSLLGNHEPLRTLAMELLPHGYLPEIVRTNAGWQGTPPGIHQRRVLVRVTDPREPIEVRNLVGEPMTVAAVENARTLLIGYGLDPVEHRLPNRELRVRCLDLRATDPTAVTNLREVLGETGNLVLRVYYGVREQDARFQDALDSFRGDDEYGLQFAQEMFLNEGGDALRNRGLSRPDDPGLRALIGRFKQAEERKAQQQIAEQYDPTQSLPGDSALVLANRARNELRRLIEGDRHAQAAILAGVRGRLVQAGYTPESVLFELFQNADDAYVERHRPAGAGAWFGVAVDADGITVSHDGRVINRPGPEHAYDLRKMLALHHSDKGVDGQDVTGKFGLGFKSVFLVCDDPRIVSGRLAVVVVGGAYPLPLDAAEASALRRRLPSETSTLFHLPTLASATAGWGEQFRRLAHLLPVFARRIRVIRTDGPPLAWENEREIVATPTGRVVVGRLAPDSGPPRALVVRCGELGDVLFGLSDDGFVAMPDDVPSVWVTAPTAEVHRLGYVVNARELPIDIGRSQVAWTQPDAGRVVRGLARVLGEALVALFDAGGEGLEVSANAAVVWRSFWDVAKTKGERGELRDGLMWGPHGAARRLFTERNTLPTGLDATGYSDPTSLTAVRGIVAGIMDQQTDVFRMVAGWVSFRAAHPPGSLVAASQVGDLLPELPRIDFAAATGLEMATSFVDPSLAATLGHVLSRDRLNKLYDRGGEIERVKDSLKVAQFRNAAGAWVAPTELVAAGAKGEEALRAGFAPPARVLAPGYTGAGVEFFQACRGDMQASVEILEGWVHKADTEEKRNAALRYLAQGELRQQLLLRLRLFRFNWTWLKALSRDQMLAAGLNELEQAQLAAATSPPTTPATPPLSQRPAADRVLERIASWWKKNQTSELEGYYGRIYPGGRRPAVTADDSLQIAAVREAWLKLLITGAVQTIGRVKPEQSRDFLRVCEREGWLGVLCDPATGPKEWLLAVERYVDNPKNHTNSIRYFHWLRHFVGVDTIARHLGAYASSFLSVDRFKTKFSPEKVLTSRSSPEFQFGGPDAPTLAPILGIGACFVLRELVRSNVVTKDGVHPYCFPPTRTLRWRLEALGWQDDQKATPADRSRSVHKFLEEHYPTDPTFGSAFDIPLLTCPEDWFDPSATPDVSTTPSLFPGGGK